MDRPSRLALRPAMLSPGAVVGNWRVEAWAGRGVYGTVYHAVPLQAPHASRAPSHLQPHGQAVIQAGAIADRSAMPNAYWHFRAMHVLLSHS